MKYETKNSFGKRMVRESKIKQIGQGGGTEYTAGDNITIEDGVISAKDTIYSGGYGIYKDDADESYYFTGNGTGTIALTENGTGIDFSVILKSGGGINSDGDGLRLDSDIVVDNVTASNSVTTNDMNAMNVNIAEDIMVISATNNAYSIRVYDDTKPFEISNETGAWIRIGTDGLVSLTSIDSTTSTAHLYEFKPDGIYLDNVKITS